MISFGPLLASILKRADTRGQILFVCPEECVESDLLHLKNEREIQVLTNRVDLGGICEEHRIESIVNDFDFSALSPCSQMIVHRISKDKLLTQHVILEAYKKLEDGGTLLLFGQNREGVMSYTRHAEELFGNYEWLYRSGGNRVSKFKKKVSEESAIPDKSEYTGEIQIEEGDKRFTSKPGVFGWKKIDQGSAMLAGQLPAFAGKSVLDLGCGYGYLSLHCFWKGARRVVATDNNATAVLVCKENFKREGVLGEVILDDCAGAISEKFDVVVCNPPFHKGTGVDRSLIKRFLGSIKARLAAEGNAYIVYNSFLPFDELCRNTFSSMEFSAVSNQFKCVKLSNRK